MQKKRGKKIKLIRNYVYSGRCRCADGGDGRHAGSAEQSGDQQNTTDGRGGTRPLRPSRRGGASAAPRTRGRGGPGSREVGNLPDGLVTCSRGLQSGAGIDTQMEKEAQQYQIPKEKNKATSRHPDTLWFLPRGRDPRQMQRNRN